MKLARLTRHRRTLLWLGWPSLAILGWLAVLAFVHFRSGWGLYWAWTARTTLPAILLLAGPPAAVEAWIRIRRRRR